MSISKKGQSKTIPIAPSMDFVDEPATGAESPAVSRRVLYLSIQAVINAIVIGIIAKLLVGFINLITNLSFYGVFSFEHTSPANNNLGYWVVVVPVIGGLIIGVMARMGSAAIRGHGIPEAMEQVLTNESRIKPIVTILKPISAAISIGTGGPFGSEGPIISTGGAFGSLAGQIMNITPNERKIMLSAGATAGMAAIFGTPVAAVLLAVELLLFEFSPRSIIPVALACATGAAMHIIFFGSEPVFGMPAIPAPSSAALAWYILLGAVVGVISAFISKSIYFIEDMFEKLPIHWMWWPAIGAVAIGVIGYFAPYTLGVGYDNITDLLTGSLPLKLVMGLCIMKFLSWSVSLGSGTSGGTLAPLLTIGGATGIWLGILVLDLFPHSDINLATCALIGMASMFAGASRALLTSIVFAFESTMQPHGLLPLLGACTASYFVSFFMMKGTIMTEKIQRRGVVTPDAFEPDIFQSVKAENVMESSFPVASIDNTVGQMRQWLRENPSDYQALVVNDPNENLMGILLLSDLYREGLDEAQPIEKLVQTRPVYVYPDTKLSLAVDLMDRFHTEFVLVVNKDDKNEAMGVLTAPLIFAAYRRRRMANDQFQRAISLKRRGYKLIVQGKQLFK